MLLELVPVQSLEVVHNFCTVSQLSNERSMSGSMHSSEKMKLGTGGGHENCLTPLAAGAAMLWVGMG